jgi:probable F420-dependent oxidoreductase
MEIGVTLRNMGPQSTAATMAAGAEHAEAAGFESLWIVDHIAIPPDDAEGSGGRYTDPLTTLAWLAARTTRIHLGIGVLILPYRPPLPTAKAIATIQELSGERMLLGCGVGWMEPEFRALGVPRRERGRRTDEMLGFLRECFGSDVVEANGQPLVFAPRPACPPLYVGGAAPHALERALRYDAGWMPMARDAAGLSPHLETFERLAGERDRRPGPVTVLTSVPSSDADAAADALRAYADLGVERVVCAQRYADLDDYRRRLDALAAVRDAL